MTKTKANPTDEQGLGGNSGSREPDPSCTGSGLSGFDPGRIAELAAKAAPLLQCGQRANRPNPRVPGERVVGFVIGEDNIGLGLSEPLFALAALVELARHAIAMETQRAETGNTDSVAKP